LTIRVTSLRPNNSIKLMVAVGARSFSAKR
jgi:hypothetical protein